MPPKIAYTRPSMTDYQREIMDCPERFACIEASTKAGKTACMIVWLLEQALLCGPNQSVYWVAPVFAQARIAFERMKSQINDRNFFKVNETRLTLTLPHGSVIEFKSGDNPDTLYGNDCYAAVLDEASRMREASWVAIRSTLTATNGKCKLIGNVRGRKNFFYKMAMRAKGGEPGYFYRKITAYDAVKAGILKLEEIESAKRDLPESVFNELYLAEASEDGSNPFGLKYIAAICQPTLSTEPSICHGIDVANKFDSTSIIGLDRLGTMSHYHNFTRTGWPHVISTIKYLSPVPAAQDSTGVGDVVLAEVQQVNPQIEGYIFTQQSKQRLLEGLAVGIQSRKLLIADDGDVVNGTGKLRHQLEQFEITYTRTGVVYSAPEGEHDDDVYALALAWYKWQTAAQMGSISVW